MRALIISPTFPPVRSGGADFAYGFCERLGQRGTEVQVVTSAEPNIARSNNFGLTTVKHNWGWRDLLFLARLTRGFRPDVVEIHFAGSIYHHHPMVTFLPQALKLFARRPRIVLFVEYPEPVAYRPRKILDRFVAKAVSLWRRLRHIDPLWGTLLRQSDAIILLCEPHRTQLIEIDPQIAARCETIAPPPPVKISSRDDDEATSVRKKLGIDSNQTLLAYYGYVYPNKGIETLLDAFCLVAPARPGLRLILIGGANEVVLRTLNRPFYLEELKKRIVESDIADRVIWTDFYPAESEEPSRLLRAADICVLPFDDGVLMHRSTFAVAAAHELPIITTRGKHLESIFVDGENVLLCKPRNPESLAEAINLLIARPELQRRLSEGARKLSSNFFSWPRCLERTLAVFQKERSQA